MSRPVRSLVMLLLVAAACGESPEASGRVSGRFVLSGVARGTLVREGAVAWWCEADSVLSAVAVGDRWSAALAVRTGSWPLDTAAAFALGSMLAGPGSAAIGVRPLRDSVGAAYVGRSGTVRLSAGGVLGGSVEGAAVSGLGDTLRLSGTLSGIRVQSGRCPS